MRKTLSLLVLVALWSGSAFGDRIATYGAMSPIPFHKYLAQGAPVIPDSAAVAAKASRGSDTTAIVSLATIPIPHSQVTAGQADTVSWFNLIVGQGSAAPTADSIYVGQQVSLDGNKWVTVSNNRVFLAASTIPPVASATILENNSNDAFAREYRQATATTGLYNTALVTTAPTDIQMWGWPFIRFIITWSAVDAGSSFSAFIYRQVQ